MTAVAQIFTLGYCLLLHALAPHVHWLGLHPFTTKRIVTKRGSNRNQRHVQSVLVLQQLVMEHVCVQRTASASYCSTGQWTGGGVEWEEWVE